MGGGGCFHSSDGGWDGHDRKVAGLEEVGGYNAGAMTTDDARANTLYYGDNLALLREHVPDESVDLVYLDPPFNSNASYNVLFKERTGEESPAQIVPQPGASPPYLVGYCDKARPYGSIISFTRMTTPSSLGLMAIGGQMPKTPTPTPVPKTNPSPGQRPSGPSRPVTPQPATPGTEIRSR